MRVSRSDNAAELNKFSALAERWWDTGGEMRALHDINEPRAGFIERRAALADARVLDVGCGGGILAEALARRGARVTGVDGAGELIEVARAHARDQNLDIAYRQIATRELVAEAAGDFDIVVGYELLEHLDTPGYVVDDCAALCAPGGHVFFSTINRSPLAWALAVGCGEYVLGLLPRGTHEYAKLLRPSELAGWCRGAGLDVAEITAMHYNPVFRTTTFGGAPRVNYFLHARKQQSRS